MQAKGPALLLAITLAGFVGGLVVLFRLRVAHGDAFPAYSSLRADPIGVRVLHDSLAALPGLVVERQFKPIADLEPGPVRTIVMAGVRAGDWTHVTREELDALDGVVRGGGRLVIALRAQAAASAEERREEEQRAKKREKR